MAGFKVQSSKFKFPIVNENDALIKEYVIDIGNESFLRSITEKGKKVVDDVSANRYDIDASKATLKSFIDLVFGEGQLDFLYAAMESNLFAMIELTKAIYFEIEGKWKSRLSAYE